MTYKKSDSKTESKSLEEQKALADKQAESLVPQSAGALIEAARKADTRADADYMTNQRTDPNAINLVRQQEDAKKAPEEKPKEKELSEAEYERRTRLDVSDPNYLNPSLGKK